MPSFSKNLLTWVMIGLVAMVIVNAVTGGMDRNGAQQVTFSDFLIAAKSGKVSSVTIKESPEKGTMIAGTYDNGKSFVTLAPSYSGLVDVLTEHNVKISAAPATSSMDAFWGVILSWFPVILLIAAYIFVMRQMQGGGAGGKGGPMGFGRSRARMLTEKNQRVTFEDVAGIDEAKQELEEIVDFLKDPPKFQRLGGRIPRGVLLVGPPGTGKTLLARSIAGEAGVPFFTISGSDFVEMFVGVGASRVRDMFEQGKKHSPCIIFIDEIDAVGRHRGMGMGGGNDEREQTLNQLLVEMDGFEPNDSVIIIAATNRPDVLDPALLRPGRFDRQVTVPNPDIKGREQILNVHLKKVPAAPDVDPLVIARGTPGFSGADLSNLVNEAALLAARRNKKVVTMQELEAAKDKVMMGAERKSMVMGEDEKKLTAYHEGGHALVSLKCPGTDPIHKATIIPRGRALGMVMRLPEKDKLSETREKMHSDLAVAMGGRVAEELIFGYEKVTSGASSDIKYATRVARAMVTEWGMSDLVGPTYYGDDSNDPYAGAIRSGQMSDKVAAEIDEEIKSIVHNAQDRARKILEENIDDLHNIAKNLLEYETLTGDEIKALINGEAIRQNEAEGKPITSARRSVPSRRAAANDVSEDDNNNSNGEAANG